MSNDWQAGDRALCIANGMLICPNGECTRRTDLKLGAVYTVLGVMPDNEWGGEPCLVIDGTRIAASRRFRKLLPDKAKACTPDFAILLQLSKKRAMA